MLIFNVILYTDEIIRTLGEGTFGKVVCCNDRYVPISIYIYVCMYVSMYVCTCMYMYLCMFPYVYIYIYICMYMYVYVSM